MGLGELGMLRIVGFEQIEILVAVAVGDEDDLRAVRRPGDVVIVGGTVGHLHDLGVRADVHAEQLAVDGEGHELLVGGQARTRSRRW